jgi:hypothetical protein
MEGFATHANWVAHKNPKEAQESLLREKVIDLESSTRHGENKSPFIR